MVFRVQDPEDNREWRWKPELLLLVGPSARLQCLGFELRVISEERETHSFSSLNP